MRTNFRMPDVITLALGGGTIVGPGAALGPRSVGYRIHDEALVFGGTTPTLTDAAVWAGRAAFGERAATEPHAALLEAALAELDRQLADAVDQMKTARADVTLIAVGGGSVLMPEALPGVGEIIIAPHHGVANAVGAATASAGGEVDAVIATDGDRPAQIEALKREACERAVQAGARPDLVEVVEVDEIPFTYMFSPTARVRVRAAGPIASAR